MIVPVGRARASCAPMIRRADAVVRLALAWVAAACAAGCASPRTEILLVVDSDLAVPAQIDHLAIRADGDVDAGFEQTYDLTQRATALPFSLGLVSKDGAARPLHVVVTALAGATPVVTRSASTMFVAGAVRVLSLDLLAACRGVVCADAGETCVAGACVSDDVPSKSLPPYGADASARQESTDAATDAAPSDAAGDVGDAAPTDAGAGDGNDDAAGKDVGLPCGAAGECASGHCVDGVCCATACTGACVTCALPASPGRCALIAAGAPDPRFMCADQGAASCGTNGTCDGAGACARYAATTTCAASRCDGDMFVAASTCAGGHCAAPAAITCDPGACAATGCAVPPTLTVTNVTASAAQGYTAAEATEFGDACPSGQVVIGFQTTSNAPSGPAVVDQLQTVCGVATISVADGSVAITPGATLIVRGDVAGTAAASLCPADQVVVGFDGRAFALLDQLSVRCAPLPFANGAVAIGTPTNLAPVGGTGGDPFPRTDCGPGAIAVGANIYTRTYVSAFGLACATVGVK
jgi:hypothetical protein